MNSWWTPNLIFLIFGLHQVILNCEATVSGKSRATYSQFQTKLAFFFFFILSSQVLYWWHKSDENQNHVLENTA